MNSLDRLDQLRSMKAIMRRDKWVPLIVFKYLLATSLKNAYKFLQNIVVPGEVTYRITEFKRRGECGNGTNNRRSKIKDECT